MNNEIMNLQGLVIDLTKVIKQQNKIIEMMIVKLDHIDNNMFPDPENESFNLNTKKDYANNEHYFTEQIMSEFNTLKENLK